MERPNRCTEFARRPDGSQALDLQRDAIVAAGVAERRIYHDTASGKNDDRPGLAACLQSLREGDTLVVWKLDRAIDRHFDYEGATRK